MNDELNEYLDGDRELEELSPEAQAEAEMWRRLTGEMKADEPRQAPVWMENAVMSQIALADAPKESVLGWLLRPRTIRLSPVTSLAMAAAAVAEHDELSLSGGDRDPPGPDPVAIRVIEDEIALPSTEVTGHRNRRGSRGIERELHQDLGDGHWSDRRLDRCSVG